MRPGSVRICEGGEGLIFPAGGEWEAEWHDAVKIVLYLTGLCYCFLGMNVVCDTFMSAIEEITAKKRQVLDKETGRHRTVKVWNDTVSNLTLMALGSSAPEILLSVIELFKNEMHATDLGPGTIVGSAAFNLLGISAVCVLSIPSRPTAEVRKIKDVTVYAVTATFSILAYVWLLVMLLWASPELVEVWEGLVTLFLFPVMVFLAFCADKGWLGGRPARKPTVMAAELTKEELAQLILDIKAQFGDLDDETVAEIIQQRTQAEAKRSRAHYRAGTTKGMTKTVCKVISELSRASVCSQSSQGAAETVLALRSEGAGSRKSTRESKRLALDFATRHYAISEGAGKLIVEVRRLNEPQCKVRVGYRTRDGTAKANSDYKPTSGILEFEPGIRVQQISVGIIDDSEWEASENFFIDLLELASGENHLSSPGRSSGLGFVVPLDAKAIATTTVTIVDDDAPGKLSFPQDLFRVEQGEPETTLSVQVHRRHGCRGAISCKYRTENDSAVAPFDFEELDGVLSFKDGELENRIEIAIKGRGRYETTGRFRLVLFEPEGCSFEKESDGGEDMEICWVELRASEQHKTCTNSVYQALNVNFQKTRLGTANYKEQLRNAIYVGGSQEEQAEASCLDWAVHLVALPWKAIFALIPPTDFAGGWLCFVCSLGGIGFLTAIVGDLASLLGCSLNLKEFVTAITFVALGTSLPDTFASRTAALQDPYADASIGNVTGSNSVNVFLGLGISWTIGAIFWVVQGPTPDWRAAYPTHLARYPKGGFAVPSAGLESGVGIYVALALTCILFLFARRKLYGGELGGPLVPKVASGIFLFCLWLTYVGASWAVLEIS